MGTYFRNEIKYLCSQQQLEILRKRIEGCGCKPDSHADETGTYRIRSVYFDDHKDSCFWENLNGNNPRKKYRIRIYNGERSIIKLECKHKVNNKIHKDACIITEEECRSFINGVVPYREEKETLFDTFSLMVASGGFRPKVIVEYERTAFVYPIGNVRITFDRYVSSSVQYDSFLEEKISKRPVMPMNMHVVEVKYDEMLPDYIYNSLQTEKMCRSAYSKYCVCRKYSM